MKIIFLTVTIYVHAYAVLGASTTKEYPIEPDRGIKDAIEEKCIENSHNKNSFVNLNEAFDNYGQCQVRTLNQVPHPLEQHDEFCRYFQESGFYSCMEDLANAALPCLDKTEIFFPNMLLKAYNTTFDTFCGTSKYFLNKIQQNRECLSNASQIIPKICVRNLTAYKNFNLNIVDLNQEDYCTDMERFLMCATEVAEYQCDEKFGIIKLYIFDLFLNMCKKAKRPKVFIRF